ncbi:cryptochrome/photolyase family protein [Methanococcoides burtonii]|uniref:Deoxyribodipyrimidine photolyase n=1 Tax=Methanococcoides burtonii (strain DSM 6242 / NBRC 107633 / OCM 468 / ACE-M) TaxID=259564 RepID=Q12TR5_METBU|nr:deoxyribodipyrimidine photo-lyase [Methanococcoides burtonii]ABE53161.1 Deoxyribodipyrimidine photolyase [Methanococcoides burtonii DSM 6242]
MTSRLNRSLFVFRRDMRVDDNSALLAALDMSDVVIPCFILDPRLCDPKGKAFNSNALQFLLESLYDLKGQLEKVNGRLYLFSGLPEGVIGQLLENLEIDAVFVNHDYTPFSIKRDMQIASICTDKGVDMLQFHDCLLHEPGSIRTKKGTPYKVFTQFFREASKRDVAVPSMFSGGSFFTGDCGVDEVDEGSFLKRSLPERNEQIFVHGGRANGLSVLQSLSQFVNYDTERDLPSVKGTTGLSAHNKLGTISIREFYYSVIDELGRGHTLINELYWRDFFTQISFEFPDVFKHAFKKKFDHLSWDNDRIFFDAWCLGKTGFPIVDAGMRELNTTGYMHNRVRMIVASFLVKDLHIDWKRGERYFASKLVDYDPCVNNGNWQWAASTGADSQPYFRIFNPWLQQKKFDKDCKYIKKWIPELEDIEPQRIHKLEKGDMDIPGYPAPIVDHSKEREVALFMFKAASQIMDV